MKRIAMIAALLAVVAGPVWAQDYMLGSHLGTHYRGQAIGGYSSDTSFVGIKASSTGGLAIYDETPNRENWSVLGGAAIISRDTTVANTIIADSSAIIDVHNYRHMILCFKLNAVEHKAANFTNNVRLAVQIRVHLNGLADSSSTFGYYPFGVGVAGVTTGAVAKGDTLATGHISSGSAVLPWSGEFVVNFDGARAASNANTWQFPNGIALPLDSILGRDFWAPYISVRVRIINTDCWKWFGNIYLMGTSL